MRQKGAYPDKNLYQYQGVLAQVITHAYYLPVGSLQSTEVPLQI